MRKMFLKTLSLVDESGKVRRYDYHIIIDEMDVGPFSCESYGLQIEERGSGQVCGIPHITTSISRIDELCELALACEVTPLTLEDVVNDWL